MSRFAVISKHLVLIAASAIMIFPFVWMFLSSVKSDEEIFTGAILSLPSIWHWDNYVQAWQMAPFGRFFINSTVMAVGTVIGQIITCSLAAYAFAWVRFAGRQFVFIFIIATTMVPFEATMIPSYLVVSELEMLNSYGGLIIPSIVSVFGIFLLRQFFLSIPRDLIDAAKMDGCSHLRILTKIILPMSKAPLATLALFTFEGTWNSYLWPLLITNSVDMRTVQVGLRYMIDDQLGNQWPELMAATTIVIIPVLLLFLFTQKYFVRNIMHTGIK